MLVLILSLSILPNIIIGVTFYHRLTTTLQVRATQLAEQFVEQSVAYLDMYLEQIAQLNLALASNTEVQRVLSIPSFESQYDILAPFRSMSTAIESLSKTRSDISRWNVYGENGIVYSTGVPRFDAYSEIFTTEWFPLISEGAKPDTWIFNSEQNTIVHARRIHELDTGKVIGFSTLSLPVYYIDAIIREFDSDSGMNLLLFDVKNNSIVGPVRSPQWVIESINNKEKRLKNFVKVKSNVVSTDLELYMIFPVEGLIQDLVYLRWFALATFILLAVVTIAAWLKFSSHLIRPIVQLSHTMNSFSYGSTKTKAAIVSNDEIGNLAQTYNSMIDRLNTLVETIYTEQVHRRDAEWAALQAQINPHFLNNTFNSIGSVARARGVPEISKMVTALSRLFNDVLHVDARRVPLKKEIEFVTHYLEIQKLRFKDRLKVEFDIQSDTEDLLVPRFILQPLVENAVVHGIEPMPAGGKIVIRTKNGECVRIEVEDDGKGIALESAKELIEVSKRKNQRIGLYNVEERIKNMEGPTYGLDIKSAPQKGTLVSISLPKHNSHEI